MPVVEIKRIESAEVVFWKISEDEEYFYKNIILSEKSKTRLSKMKSQKHRLCFLAVRKILEDLGFSDDELLYEQNGKPYLTSGEKISISHSFPFAMVAVSRKQIGVDIEHISDRILRIAHKFSKKESSYISEERKVKQLTTIWCIKESLYKAYALGFLNFNKDLDVSKFNCEDKTTIASISKDGIETSYKVAFGELDDFVWTVVY